MKNKNILFIFIKMNRVTKIVKTKVEILVKTKNWDWYYISTLPVNKTVAKKILPKPYKNNQRFYK